MLQYKVNILEKLKEAGYSSYRIRKEKILAEGTIQTIRKGQIAITLESLAVICDLLQCQPGDLLEWIPND